MIARRTLVLVVVSAAGCCLFCVGCRSLFVAARRDVVGWLSGERGCCLHAPAGAAVLRGAKRLVGEMMLCAGRCWWLTVTCFAFVWLYAACGGAKPQEDPKEAGRIRGTFRGAQWASGCGCLAAGAKRSPREIPPLTWGFVGRRETGFRLHGFIALRFGGAKARRLEVFRGICDIWDGS